MLEYSGYSNSVDFLLLRNPKYQKIMTLHMKSLNNSQESF